MSDQIDPAKRLQQVLVQLLPLWPDTSPQLHYQNCWQLLVAVVLSAQCTDDQVNKVSPQLFACWPTPADLGSADFDQVATVIHSTGFFRNKAANIIALSRQIADQYGGQVPEQLSTLLSLPGVGRKTANLVVSACFDQPGIIVDTHVLRICYRLGLGDGKQADRTERLLADILEPAQYTAASHALNRHGKFVCLARKPTCNACVIRLLCPSVQA